MTNVASAAITVNVPSEVIPCLTANDGKNGTPVTRDSSEEALRRSVCFCRHVRISACSGTTASRMPGTSRTCVTNTRGMTSPGNGPSNTNADRYVPTSGIDSSIPCASRNPASPSWSAGSDTPRNDSNSTSANSSTPSIQVSSRGRRNAPVKKTRNRCSTIENTKIIADQWCNCRTSSPDRTSRLICRTDSKATSGLGL